MIIDKIALALLIIGGINWGSIGIFNFDIVGSLFGGQSSAISRIIFVIVGLCAVWCISLLFRDNALSSGDDTDDNNNGIYTD
ncbi:DUF378 domain-containing protein [Anaeromassilibacillus sp. An172]|uniref:DUF378 domain-containing protein n=1 Tax=Anaeromassilibacillus sp. An172 TaxID=1965570 RepID=UPI001950EF37|nr:DUF378 domain-containing protein [Anaeromassilibacillus sp. An172]